MNKHYIQCLSDIEINILIISNKSRKMKLKFIKQVHKIIQH